MTRPAGARKVRAGFIRVASILGALQIFQSTGRKIDAAIEGAGLPTDIFSDPDNQVPFAAAAIIMSRCAEITGIRHFGLLAGARNGLNTFGLIGHLAETAPDVETAVNDLIGHLNLHIQAAQVTMISEAGRAKITYILDHPGAPGAEHFYDGAAAAIHNVLRSLCGQDFAATCVTLPRRKPQDTAPYQDYFRTKLLFGAEAASVSFSAAWLRHRVPGANASLRAFLQRLAQNAQPHRGSLVTDIRRIIRLQLLDGKPGIDRVAAMLQTHRRTLARRLAAEGATFRALVQDVRFEMAADLLKQTDISLARISELLGYSDQTTFSRAFSNRFRRPPSQHRAMAS